MTTPQFNGVVQRPEVWYMILRLELPTTDGFYHVCHNGPAPVEFFCFSGEEQHALLLVEMRLGTEGTPEALRNSEDPDSQTLHGLPRRTPGSDFYIRHGLRRHQGKGLDR